jgi:sporulation protein YlmC with PRC-barrel domain
VDLVRDLLDKRLVDRNGREMGRVDRIMLQVRAGAPPRVAMLEVGPSVLASRLHPVLGRVVAALEYACGVHEGRPVRVAFHDVIDVHDHVRVDVAVGETGAGTIEHRLRRLVRAVPWSR